MCAWYLFIYVISIPPIRTLGSTLDSLQQYKIIQNNKLIKQTQKMFSVSAGSWIMQHVLWHAKGTRGAYKQMGAFPPYKLKLAYP